MKEVNGIVITDKIMKHVWDILDDMNEGQVMEIKVKNPDLFVECAKYHIDCFQKHEFNNEYTEIKRLQDCRIKL